MSIKLISDLVLEIYIKKEIINNTDLNNNDVLEKYLKVLFKKLKDIYNITIEGFYDITVYKDNYYGVVFHLAKEELEYYEYFKNQVDMRIKYIETNFLYEVEDILEEIVNKVDIYIIENKIYLKLKEELTNVEMMMLLENSRLVYDK